MSLVSMRLHSPVTAAFGAVAAKAGAWVKHSKISRALPNPLGGSERGLPRERAQPSSAVPPNNAEQRRHARAGALHVRKWNHIFTASTSGSPASSELFREALYPPPHGPPTLPIHRALCSGKAAESRPRQDGVSRAERAPHPLQAGIV